MPSGAAPTYLTGWLLLMPACFVQITSVTFGRVRYGFTYALSAFPCRAGDLQHYSQRGGPNSTVSRAFSCSFCLWLRSVIFNTVPIMVALLIASLQGRKGKQLHNGLEKVTVERELCREKTTRARALSPQVSVTGRPLQDSLPLRQNRY